MVLAVRWCLEKPLDSDGSRTLGSNLFSLPLRKEEFIQLVYPKNRADSDLVIRFFWG